MSSDEVLRPGLTKIQTPYVQQTMFIPQPGPLAAMTYSSPLIHTTQQNHGPNYHSKGVEAYDQKDRLEEKFDQKFDKMQLELKALSGKDLFGKSAYDLCLVPNVVIPH